MGRHIDIAVVGAGASGMAAAVCAARSGASVTLIEAQNRAGRKLLSTGNGRCNISNASISAEHYRSKAMDRVAALLDCVPPDEILDFLCSLGLDCFEEREGRIYPRSEQAASVLDMLRAELERLGVSFISECRITSVRRKASGFELVHDGGLLQADKVIIACGSEAAPQLGGRADGLALTKALGHKALPFTPALVGLKADSPHLRALKGVRWRCSSALSARVSTFTAKRARCSSTRITCRA